MPQRPVDKQLLRHSDDQVTQTNESFRIAQSSASMSETMVSSRASSDWQVNRVVWT